MAKNNGRTRVSKKRVAPTFARLNESVHLAFALLVESWKEFDPAELERIDEVMDAVNDDMRFTRLPNIDKFAVLFGLIHSGITTMTNHSETLKPN